MLAAEAELVEAEALDDAAEEFRKLAEDPENKSSEALYYLAKTYATKSGFLRSLLEEDDVDSDEAREATETLKRAIDVLSNRGASRFSGSSRRFSPGVFFGFFFLDINSPRGEYVLPHGKIFLRISPSVCP